MNKVYIVTAHDDMDTNELIILKVFSNHEAAAAYWAACIAKLEKYEEELKEDESNWQEWKASHPFKIGKGMATDFHLTDFEVFEEAHTHLP